MTTASSPPTEKPWIECQAHGEFLDWLDDAAGTILVSTYNSGKLALVSCKQGELRLQVYKFARPMGLAVDEHRLAIATKESILLFDRQEIQPRADCDALYSATSENVTGKLNVHDLVFAGEKLYFANTKYNCLARPSETHRFMRSWQPEFITEIASGDRCHLNGVGVRDGRPGVVTAFCESDQHRGWREQDRFTGGILIDMQSKEVIARGLCMPHSPRWHNNRWWFCNSGLGMLCALDAADGQVEEICALPGFVRGLWFVGDHALVGLSKFRKEHVLDPSPINGRLREAQSGVAVVDTRSGCTVGMLEFVRGGREIFDVSFLPDLQNVELAT